MKAGLNVERIDAVDTRQLKQLFAHRRSVERASFRRLVGTLRRGHRLQHADLTSGAVGCALSHAKAAQEGLTSNAEVITVFEDDALVPTDIVSQMNGALACAPADWDCILLGWWDRGRTRFKQDDITANAPRLDSDACIQDAYSDTGTGARLWLFEAAATEPPAMLMRVEAFWGLHAYMLSCRGMRKLVELCSPLRIQVDSAVSASDMKVYGVAARNMRVRQHGRGSDVHFPVRTRVKDSGDKE